MSLKSFRLPDWEYHNIVIRNYPIVILMANTGTPARKIQPAYGELEKDRISG
jgi:hypothetical protein